MPVGHVRVIMRHPVPRQVVAQDWHHTQ
jgi:hypothetical protein